MLQTVNKPFAVITNNQDHINSLETQEDELQERRNMLQEEIVTFIETIQALVSST